MSNNQEVITPMNNRRLTGAGVLIITSKFNRPHLLLGRETYKSFIYKNKFMIPIYEDFGGGIQTKKMSTEENALMELDEETAHLLNWSDPNVLLKKGFFYIDIPYLDSRMYRLYLVYVKKVDHIIPHFNRNFKLINSHKSRYYKKKNYIEMDSIDLLSLDEIYKTLNNSFSKNIIHLLNGDYVLKLRNENKYLSRRLYHFFNDKFMSPITNKEEYGYDLCYQIFNRSFRQVGINDEYYITLKRPYKNVNNVSKLSFLDYTTTYDAK